MTDLTVFNLTTTSLFVNNEATILPSRTASILGKNNSITIIGQHDGDDHFLTITCKGLRRHISKKLLRLQLQNTPWIAYSLNRTIYILPKRDLRNYLADFGDDVGLNELCLPGEFDLFILVLG
jgi:hypothetical protein